jgi:serine/threonine-protein kinase RsbW
VTPLRALSRCGCGAVPNVVDVVEDVIVASSRRGRWPTVESSRAEASGPGRRKGGEDTMCDQGLEPQWPCDHLRAAATDAQVAMLLFVPRAARSVAAVRHHVRDLICQRGLQHVADDVELLTSELATNAVQHAAGFRYAVAVRVCPGLILVEVFDSAPERPLLHERDSEREGGRGLATVAALAKDWGSGQCAHGKRVWFTVHAWPRKRWPANDATQVAHLRPRLTLDNRILDLATSVGAFLMSPPMWSPRADVDDQCAAAGLHDRDRAVDVGHGMGRCAGPMARLGAGARFAVRAADPRRSQPHTARSRGA